MSNCDRCKVPLTPVFPEHQRRKDDYPQFEGALIIQLNGGYGMFIDPMLPEEFAKSQRLLCNNCATKFIGLYEAFMIYE